MRLSCRSFDVVVAVGGYPTQRWPWMIELNTMEMLNVKKSLRISSVESYVCSGKKSNAKTMRVPRNSNPDVGSKSTLPLRHATSAISR